MLQNDDTTINCWGQVLFIHYQRGFCFFLMNSPEIMFSGFLRCVAVQYLDVLLSQSNNSPEISFWTFLLQVFFFFF